MVDERDSLWQKVTELQSSVRLLETKVDGEVKSLAPRDWVHQVMQPIQQSITRMEASVSQLTEDAKDLFNAHSTMLKEKADREKQEWAEKTPLGLIKKYGPVIGFMAGIVALYRALGSLFEVWLQQYK